MNLQNKHLEAITIEFAKEFAEWACGLYLRIEKDDEGNQWKERLLGRYYTTDQLIQLFKQKKEQI